MGREQNPSVPPREKRPRCFQEERLRASSPPRTLGDHLVSFSPQLQQHKDEDLSSLAQVSELGGSEDPHGKKLQ